MDYCYLCRAKTQLYSGGVPVCIACDEEPQRKPAAQELQVEPVERVG